MLSVLRFAFWAVLVAPQRKEFVPNLLDPEEEEEEGKEAAGLPLTHISGAVPAASGSAPSNACEAEGSQSQASTGWTLCKHHVEL